MLDMRRREFISLLGCTAASSVSLPILTRAQQPTMPVIGLLYGVSASEWTDRIDGFRRGLSDVGFVEGRNVAIEYRWADGQFDRLPAMAADLVGRKVAVILAGGSSNATQAAIAATQSIPIVFTTVADPVAAGFVASLNRPGGNVTGITTFGSELGPKRLELLRELIPTASKIALLVNQNSRATSQVFIQDAQTAARLIGLEVIVVSAGSENEIETALAIAVQQHAAAVSVVSDGFLVSRRAKIAALALQYAVPTMSTGRDSVIAGQLMSYASNSVDLYRQAGTYVGRILKGAKPADLPVLQPTKFDLVINLKTAKALALNVPPTLLARADEVIE